MTDPGAHSFGIYTKISLPVSFNVTQIASQLLSSKVKQVLGSMINAQRILNNPILRVTKVSSIVNPKPSYFSVIVSSYSLEDRFKDFLGNADGGVIGLIGGGFAAGFSALLVDRLKKRVKR